MNREKWLTIVASEIETYFSSPMPAYQISMGWPLGGSNKSNPNKVGRLGECYPLGWQATEDKFQIMISPILGQNSPESTKKYKDGDIAGIVAHELCHVMDQCKNGHRKPFAKLAYSIGLEGKPTQAMAGDAFINRITPFLNELGSYPHNSMSRDKKKRQGTRMIKCTCDECGYAVRTSQKWIDVALPICPIHNSIMVIG
jgi:hypothetical protein